MNSNIRNKITKKKSGLKFKIVIFSKRNIYIILLINLYILLCILFILFIYVKFIIIIEEEKNV